MAEPIAIESCPAPDPGTALTARAAALARRIADVLLASCTPGSGAPEAATFLTRWAESSAEDVSSPAALPITVRRLVDRLGLTELEVELVVLAGLADEHQGLAATFRGLHPAGEPRPTLGLAALLAGGGSAAFRDLRATVCEGTAVATGLLRIDGAGPFFERSLLLADAMWAALHGHDARPAALPPVRFGPPPSGLDGWLTEPGPRRALATIAAGRPALVLVTSDDETVRVARCAALGQTVRGGVLAARVDAADGAGLALLGLHAAVRDAVAVAVVPRPETPPALLSLDGVRGVLVVCAPPGAVRPAADRPVAWLPAGPVSPEDQRAAWAAAAPDLPDRSVAALAARHRLDPAVTAQLGLDLAGAAPTPIEVAELIRLRLASTLPPGVELVTPDVPWDALVLPAEAAAQLRDAVARLDHAPRVLDDWGLRRRAFAVDGARVLLAGPPGTGKSLAARAVATAAGTDLLVVDLSQIVSKWLGETEKNLAAAFDAAERTQAVLMLDEADALFGTRTEITDAHDRYANLETSYLLTRLDRFEGLAILTTNMRTNVDPAFLRRIDHVVELPLPDQDGRAELWRRHLPPEPLAADVDQKVLTGLYPVSGAWIRNASVAAAFTAAADGGVITQEHLVDAMRREYAKASLPFPGAPPRRRHEPAR